MTHVTCRLATKNRDQLRNPTLGNRVRAIFTFSKCTLCCDAEPIVQLAPPTNAVIGPSPAQRRAAATSKNPTTCTLPSDAISHNLIHNHATQSQNRPTAVGVGWRVSSTASFMVRCAWSQAACNRPSAQQCCTSLTAGLVECNGSLPPCL